MSCNRTLSLFHFATFSSRATRRSGSKLPTSYVQPRVSLLSPLQSTVTIFVAISPLKSTVANSLDLNHLWNQQMQKNQGGYPINSRVNIRKRFQVTGYRFQPSVPKLRDQSSVFSQDHVTCADESGSFVNVQPRQHFCSAFFSAPLCGLSACPERSRRASASSFSCPSSKSSTSSTSSTSFTSSTSDFPASRFRTAIMQW